MKPLFVFIIIFLLAVSVVSAVTGPINFNGKQYYVVTSTDPTGDSGDEVCTKVGMACVGYTEPTNAVCKLNNPSAASASSLSGDDSGVYCDGAPQNGVCSTETNTCHTCADCTVSVQCDQAIGGLYREMYVECSPGSCSVTIYASTVQDFLNQIPSLNAQLQGCPQSIPSFAGALLSNGNTQVDILRTNGQTTSLNIVVSNGIITGVTTGAPNSCTQKITLSEADLNAAAQSTNPGQALANMYGQGKVKISGCSFFSGLRVGIINLFAKPAAKKIAPVLPPPKPAPNCGNVGEQCNNRGCFSGICGAPNENINGQWGHFNYQCLDQSDWNAYCQGRGNTPAPWACLTGPCS